MEVQHCALFLCRERQCSTCMRLRLASTNLAWRFPPCNPEAMSDGRISPEPTLGSCLHVAHGRLSRLRKSLHLCSPSAGRCVVE